MLNKAFLTPFSKNLDKLDGIFWCIYQVEAGIGVLVLSWYPPSLADENGLPSDPMVRPLLDAALVHGLKICLHLEPYK